jgi:hypothetical protein
MLLMEISCYLHYTAITPLENDPKALIVLRGSQSGSQNGNEEKYPAPHYFPAA